MEPTAKIYTARSAKLKRCVPFVLAGVTVLSGGALLGKYLGEQAAAARTITKAEWQVAPDTVASAMRKSSLLRGSLEDAVELDLKAQDRIGSLGKGDSVLVEKSQERLGETPRPKSNVVAESKDQDRIGKTRPVIRARKGKSDPSAQHGLLAALVPAAPEVDDLLRTGSVSSKSNARNKPTVVLTDKPLSTERIPLPGELSPADSDKVGIRGFVGLDKPQPMMRHAPSKSKVLAMASLGKKAKVAYVKRKKGLTREVNCMAKAIYHEARGEPTLGQLAVAGVVMNRVAHRRYPNTVCGVVFQNDHMRNACQFSFACDGKSDAAHDRKQWRRALKMAKSFVVHGKKAHAIRTATHYHADYVNPRWSRSMRKVRKIGRHIFYYPEKRVASRRATKKRSTRVSRSTRKPGTFTSSRARIEPASSR